MIEFENVCKTYDKSTDTETKAVRDISLKIEKGNLYLSWATADRGRQP